MRFRYFIGDSFAFIS